MIYDLIAPLYDRVNAEVDYVRWADFYEEIIRREYRAGKPELVLDLASGTGKMTLELARRGYDMTGVDASAEMLDIARRAGEDAGLSDKLLWLCQDMREFELYGTVDVTVCCLDSINHLSTLADLRETFALVHNYLIPDGLFLFDVNTKHKFATQYADKTYTVETDDAYLIWENDYRDKSGICDFYITMFRKLPDGTYEREDDVQRERAYSLATLKRELCAAGFEWIGAYGDESFGEVTGTTDRAYVAVKCKK